MTITGPDVSKYQGAVDFGAVARAGHMFAVVKATEGVGYTSPTFAAQRAGAHAAGLVVGLYHFGRFGPGEAAYFLSVIGALQPGEFLVLDQEVPSSIAWCKAWLDAVFAATGVRPLIYMNQSASTGLGMGNWSAVAASYGLWLARYDNSQAQPSVPYWGAPAMKQFTDRASVPGVSGTCDLNVFYGSRDQLLAYGQPGGGDVPLTQQDIDNIWLLETVKRGGVPPNPAIQELADTKTLGLANQQALADLSAKVEELAAKLDALAVAQTPTGEAQQIADLVIAQLGQRINTPPASS